MIVINFEPNRAQNYYWTTGSRPVVEASGFSIRPVLLQPYKSGGHVIVTYNTSLQSNLKLINTKTGMEVFTHKRKKFGKYILVPVPKTAPM